MIPARVRLSLVVLRLSLGLFLALWGVDKLVAPEATAGIFARFYGVEITAGSAQIIGILELGLSLALMAGLWRTATYGLALLLHALSTASTWRELLDPFGRDNHLFIAGIPVLAAFTVLFLLRRLDTWFALGPRSDWTDGP